MQDTEGILKKHKHNPSTIIQILGEIQNKYNYLPKEVLVYISKRLRIPLSKIFSIATFYAAFSLEPRGKHLVTVCMGTACHVRGAPNVCNRIEERLGVEAGETTKDNMFTLETVNCLGACALAPIVVIDGAYHGKTVVNKVDKLIDKYEKQSE
jgi:NADH-quinone oxidoreductase subunit E